MDSFKVVFIFVIINILESFAQLSLQDKLTFLLRLRRGNDQVKFPEAYRRTFASQEVPDSSAYVLRKSYDDLPDLDPKKFYKVNFRKMYDFHAGMRSPIIASPTMPHQLPEAEPLLPGHTLLRPALGMLKSAIKFPHKDMAEGSGVYGNFDNLGITFPGTGERVLYTGFRRNNNDRNDNPTLLVALLRQGPEQEDKPLLRYIEYGKREQEIKTFREAKKQLRLEQEKLRQDQEKLRQDQEKVYQGQEKVRQGLEKLGISLPKIPTYHNYVGTADNKLKEVKRLLKTLNANGVTLEFFDIPRLKKEALEKETYHNSIRPDTEFNEGTRPEDMTRVQTDLVVPYEDRWKKPQDSGNQHAQYTYVDLERLEEVIKQYRRQQVTLQSVQKKPVTMYDEPYISSEESDEENKKLEYLHTEKSNWFYNADQFNHIRYDAEAPDMADFMPKQILEDNTNKWWFYHQNDYVPFKTR